LLRQTIFLFRSRGHCCKQHCRQRGPHVVLLLALVGDEASAALVATGLLRVPHVVAEAVLRALPPVSQEQGMHVKSHAAKPLVSRRLINRRITNYIPEDY
jgi:hypothetical protein